MTLLISSPANLQRRKVSQTKSENSKTAIALKRYLDLTLNGKKKLLAQQTKHGRKEHPPSPYTFDRPDFEEKVSAIVNDKNNQGCENTPDWVQQINEKLCNHNGEATLFTEKFLPLHKSEQSNTLQSRPVSGISTKSVPVVINGEMYYRPRGKHNFMQASNRPFSAVEGRLTRASKLSNKHRARAMSATPSNDTKLQLKRMKDAKPRPRHIHKDLLPIPCHTGETPHSFVIGARYNCTHFMDSRSFARLGLYVPRQDPLRTFLKVYKGEDAMADIESESDYVGNTSVCVGGSSGQNSRGYKHPGSAHSKNHPSTLPSAYVRKVVKEAWLNNGTEVDNRVRHKPPPYVNAKIPSPPAKQFPKYSGGNDVQTRKEQKFVSNNSHTEGKKSSPRAQRPKTKFNVKGQHVRASSGTGNIRPTSAKRNIQAVLPKTH